jgi:hypothetical protein
MIVQCGFGRVQAMFSSGQTISRTHFFQLRAGHKVDIFRCNGVTMSAEMSGSRCLAIYCMYRQRDARCHQSDHLFILFAVLHPAGEVNESRKLCSNPKRVDSRIVQPVTIQLMSTLGWPKICKLPTAAIGRSHRDPLVVRRDLNIWRVAREEGGLHNVHEGVQKECRERDTRDV